MLRAFMIPQFIPEMSIHIIIQLSLSLSFSKYLRLKQYYEFLYIARDLRHIYQCAFYISVSI